MEMAKGEFVMPIIPTDAGKIAFVSRVNNENIRKGRCLLIFGGITFGLLNSTHRV